MSPSFIISGESFTQHALSKALRVLLINPPVYDYRLAWANWHHPLGLEQIGVMLMQAGSQVKLIDCLAIGQDRITRRKVGVQQIDEYEFVRWCFGVPPSSLKTQLRKLVEWNPDAVMITTLNSLWWQAAVDTIQIVREVLPTASIVLGGMYPTYAPDHAVAHSGADVVVTGHVPEALAVTSSFRLTPIDRKSVGILFYIGGPSPGESELRLRPTTEIIDEIAEGARGGIREFVFFD